MEKIHGNTHVFVLSCKFLMSKRKNMCVPMYFLYLVLTFSSHDIIMVNGLAITKHTLQAIEVPGSYLYACTLLPFNLLSTSGSPRLSMS